METIANRLLRVREEVRDQSAHDFARRITRAGFSITHVTVLNYEKGKGGTKKIPGDYLAAVCRATGVDPGWLLLGRGPMRRANHDGEDPYTRGVRDATDRILKDLDEVRRRAGIVPAPVEYFLELAEDEEGDP